METEVRYPSERKLLWQIVELVAALRVFDQFTLKAPTQAMQYKLRGNVQLFYTLYGSAGLTNYAYLIQYYEPGCREYKWLTQRTEEEKDDAFLDLVLQGQGGLPL